MATDMKATEQIAAREHVDSSCRCVVHNNSSTSFMMPPKYLCLKLQIRSDAKLVWGFSHVHISSARDFYPLLSFSCFEIQDPKAYEESRRDWARSGLPARDWYVMDRAYHDAVSRKVQARLGHGAIFSLESAASLPYKTRVSQGMKAE